MPTEINGLPAHPLLVHAVVVLVPLSAVLLVAAALVPDVRRRLGLALPLLAAACLVLVPVTTHAGEALAGRFEGSALVQRHAELGDQLLPWTVGVLVMSLVVWWRGRRAPDAPVPSRRAALSGSRGAGDSAMLVSVAVAVLALVVAAGTVVQTVRIGDSGARAVWGTDGS